MKNCLNKALIFKEFKYTKYLFIVFVGTLILEGSYQFANALSKISNGVEQNVIADGIGYINRSITHHFDTSITFTSFIFATALAYVLIGVERRQNYEFREVMPFSRYDVVKNKYIFGLSFISICMLINFIIFSIIYATNVKLINNIPKIILMLHYKFDNLKDPAECQYYYNLYLNMKLSYIMVVKSFVMNFLIIIAGFSLSMLMHTISGRGVLGIIFSFIAYIFPIGIFTLCGEVLSYHTKWASNSYEYFKKFLNSVYVLAYGFDKYLEGYWTKCIKIVIFIIIINIILVYCYKKYKQENVGNLVIFEKLEPIVIIGASICFGVLISTIIARITMGYSYEPSSSRALVLDSLIVVISIISYIIISRINKLMKN